MSKGCSLKAIPVAYPTGKWNILWEFHQDHPIFIGSITWDPISPNCYFGEKHEQLPLYQIGHSLSSNRLAASLWSGLLPLSVELAKQSLTPFHHTSCHLNWCFLSKSHTKPHRGSGPFRLSPPWSTAILPYQYDRFQSVDQKYPNLTNPNFSS